MINQELSPFHVLFKFIFLTFPLSYLQPVMEKIENGTYIVFEQLVPSMNLSFVMKNLRHFAAYNIEVQACRAQEMNDTYKKCSTKSMRTYRTLPLESADNIPPNTFKMSISGENNSLTMVTLQWDEPPQPNGLIITYQIEYKRVDIQNVSGIHVYLTSIGSSSQTLFTASGFEFCNNSVNKRLSCFSTNRPWCASRGGTSRKQATRTSLKSFPPETTP